MLGKIDHLCAARSRLSIRAGPNKDANLPDRSFWFLPVIAKEPHKKVWCGFGHGLLTISLCISLDVLLFCFLPLSLSVSLCVCVCASLLVLFPSFTIFLGFLSRQHETSTRRSERPVRYQQEGEEEEQQQQQTASAAAVTTTTTTRVTTITAASTASSHNKDGVQGVATKSTERQHLKPTTRTSRL